MHMQGLETLSQLNGQANEDLSEREQQSLQSYPLSLRILAQDSGVKLRNHSWDCSGQGSCLIAPSGC